MKREFSWQNIRFRALFLVFFLACSVLPAFSAALNLVYERPILDSNGNELGVQKQQITSLNDLPLSSPWRTYLSHMVDQRNMFTYAQDISKLLSRPLNLTISDRKGTSNSSKDYSGYNITLNNNILTQYSSLESQNFVFLHELGHVTMLNAYPQSYNFAGLNYGSDGAHYIDEILPNANTAWVEGWANAFGAMKNNNKIFSIPLDSDTITAFLRNNAFEEMTRNELFVAKMIFDVSALPGGKDKVFAAISKSGPHYSLRGFCAGYLSLYPQDQIALARLLDKNSYGKISQNELLAYVNGGSYTVSRSFYDYLQTRNSTKPSTTTATNNTSTTTTGTSGTKKTFWSSISDFFGNLFGSKKAAASIASAIAPIFTGQNAAAPGETSTNVTVLQGTTPPTASGTSGVIDLARAQEEYFKAFANYNDVLAHSPNDTAKVKAAYERLQATKATIEQLKKAYNANH